MGKTLTRVSFVGSPGEPEYLGGDNLIISIAGASSQGLGGVGGFSGNHAKTGNAQSPVGNGCQNDGRAAREWCFGCLLGLTTSVWRQGACQ